ncbi:MAG TPA: alpha/beta fold hydrolase [Noviherbaspirillum sp.]|nr:alpha/beta fold hydrolase [Noviherbaspirillum sp.]
MNIQLSACPSAGISSTGDGVPVVLLHSSMGSKKQWRSLIERLRAKYRVIAIDLYGYGETAFPAQTGHFSLNDEVELVRAALADVLAPWEAFHLIGHSYGGGVALRLAFDSPQRVRSLGLFEPTAFHLLPSGEPGLAQIRAVFEQVRIALEQDDAPAATRRFIDFWNEDGFFDALPAAKQVEFIRQSAKVPLDFRALLHEPLDIGHYRRLDMPMCLIRGTQSPRCATAVVDVLATLENARAHQVVGGHMAPVTHADAVNRIIEDFIASLDVEALAETNAA